MVNLLLELPGSPAPVIFPSAEANEAAGEVFGIERVEVVGAFADADRVYLMDIYSAGEKPIEGVSSGALAEAMNDQGQRNVAHVSDREALLDILSSGLEPKDVLFTLGAGDVWKMGEELLKRMSDDRASAEEGDLSSDSLRRK